MTTSTTSLRMHLPHYSAEEVDLQVDYAYYPANREFEIEAVVMPVGGAEISVFHQLTRQQTAEILDACREDHYARMESVYEERRRHKEYDSLWA